LQIKQKTTKNTQKTGTSNKTWHPTLPHTEIQHIQEEENQTTPPNTTSTVYTSYRATGVYEWEINTSDRLTNKHLKPDNYRDEEFEW